jgi:hypothetical protein
VWGPPPADRQWRHLPLVEAPDAGQNKHGYEPALTLVFDFGYEAGRIYVGGPIGSL